MFHPVHRGFVIVGQGFQKADKGAGQGGQSKNQNHRDDQQQGQIHHRDGDGPGALAEETVVRAREFIFEKAAGGEQQKGQTEPGDKGTENVENSADKGPDAVEVIKGLVHRDDGHREQERR